MRMDSAWPFFQDVQKDLSGGPVHPISFEEGTRAVSLLNALYRSAEDQLPVRVAEGLASRLLGKPDAELMARYATLESH